MRYTQKSDCTFTCTQLVTDLSRALSTIFPFRDLIAPKFESLGGATHSNLLEPVPNRAATRPKLNRKNRRARMDCPSTRASLLPRRSGQAYAGPVTAVLRLNGSVTGAVSRPLGRFAAGFSHLLSPLWRLKSSCPGHQPH